MTKNACCSKDLHSHSGLMALLILSVFTAVLSGFETANAKSQIYSSTNKTTRKTLMNKNSAHKSKYIAKNETATNLPTTASSKNSLKLAPQEKKSKPMFSGAFITQGSSSLYQFNDGTDSRAIDYELDLILNKAPLTGSPLILVITYSQDLKNNQNSSLGDTVLISKFPTLWKGKNVAFSTDAQFVFPTSKKSREVNELVLGLGPNFVLGLTPENQINKNLTLKLSASMIRLINKYTTSKDNTVLNQWSSKQSLLLGYTFFDKLGLQTEIVHRNRQDYNGNWTESYENSQEINWTFNDNVSIAAGHSNGLPPKPNGDGQLYFLSENTSMFYGSLTLSF